MAREIVPSFIDSFPELPFNQIEDGHKLDQSQLNNTKVYSSREEYTKHLPKNMRYLEIGVAWGYYSEFVAENANPQSIDLLDFYDLDLKCWSWRKFGECKCEPVKHEMKYTPETHEPYIKELFSKYKNVSTIKGNAINILPALNKEYDYIYIDISNKRDQTRKVLNLSANLVPIGGIIGLNDYLIFDGIIEEGPYGTYQTVNEFLYKNKNWSVTALALHNLGFYDIYLKREQ
jgi:hypothetical protein